VIVVENWKEYNIEDDNNSSTKTSCSCHI